MKFLAATLAVAALGAAGCGGSSGASSSVSSSQAAPSSSSTASAVSSPQTPSTAQPTFASTSNCQTLADIGRKYVAEIQSASASGHLSVSTDLSAAQAMADASPSAIHGDAEYLVHTLEGFFSELSKVGYKPGAAPSASQIATIYPLMQQFNAPRLRAAADHIRAWIHANCRGVS